MGLQHSSEGERKKAELVVVVMEMQKGAGGRGVEQLVLIRARQRRTKKLLS